MGVAVIGALVIPIGKKPVREPMGVRQSSVMKQIALAIEMYEREYREELIIESLDEIGRPYVIDKGELALIEYLELTTI